MPGGLGVICGAVSLCNRLSLAGRAKTLAVPISPP